MPDIEKKQNGASYGLSVDSSGFFFSVSDSFFLCIFLFARVE